MRPDKALKRSLSVLIVVAVTATLVHYTATAGSATPRNPDVQESITLEDETLSPTRKAAGVEAVVEAIAPTIRAEELLGENAPTDPTRQEAISRPSRFRQASQAHAGTRPNKAPQNAPEQSSVTIVRIPLFHDCGPGGNPLGCALSIVQELIGGPLGTVLDLLDCAFNPAHCGLPDPTFVFDEACNRVNRAVGRPANGCAP